MLLTTQAAAEYTALVMQRTANLLGRQTAQLQAFANEHFLAVIFGLIGVVFLLTFLMGSGRRRR